MSGLSELPVSGRADKGTSDEERRNDSRVHSDALGEKCGGSVSELLDALVD
jgi:hypothetical protein